MYTSFFGFKEKPFNVTPDPRFFYGTPGYSEVYANLLYAVRERKGFAVLTGEAGTGKTTLLRKLMDDLAMTARFVYFYHTNLNFEEILAFICEELKLEVAANDGRLRKIRSLNEFLLEQLSRGGTGVLLIDEAQNLGNDVLENLRLLSNLETGREKLLQIVLAGQPEVEIKLNQPELRQLRQRVSIQCRLDCLKQREVAPFVRYRLAAAGYQRDGLFVAEALTKIAYYSKGLPRLINVICDNALLIAYATGQKAVSAGIIDEVVQDLRLRSEIEPAAADVVSAMTALESRIVNELPLTVDPEHQGTLVRQSEVEPHSILRTDIETGHMEEETTDDPTETVFQICDDPKNREMPITMTAEDLRIVGKIDGYRDGRAIAESLNISCATTARILNSLNRLGILERVENNEISEPILPGFFNFMTSELTQALGPMARLIIEEELDTLGRSDANFQKSELAQLVELVSEEILNDELKNEFRSRMSDLIRNLDIDNDPSKYKTVKTAGNRFSGEHREKLRWPDVTHDLMNSTPVKASHAGYLPVSFRQWAGSYCYGRVVAKRDGNRDE